MGITLTERLRTIANMVDAGCRLADIGTDHGFIPIYLLTLGKIQYAVASDVHIGPLDKARENTLKYGVGENMRLCRADGMEGLGQDEVDTAVIAGMGRRVDLPDFRARAKECGNAGFAAHDRP